MGNLKLSLVFQDYVHPIQSERYSRGLISTGIFACSLLILSISSSLRPCRQSNFSTSSRQHKYGNSSSSISSSLAARSLCVSTVAHRKERKRYYLLSVNRRGAVQYVKLKKRKGRRRWNDLRRGRSDEALCLFLVL